jgi:hypothetical protein
VIDQRYSTLEMLLESGVLLAVLRRRPHAPSIVEGRLQPFVLSTFHVRVCVDNQPRKALPLASSADRGLESVDREALLADNSGHGSNKSIQGFLAATARP